MKHPKYPNQMVRIIKIALGREIWNILDVIVGIGYIASVLIKSKK